MMALLKFIGLFTCSQWRQPEPRRGCVPLMWRAASQLSYEPLVLFGIGVEVAFSLIGVERVQE